MGNGEWGMGNGELIIRRKSDE
jgi:hypothetical protein